MLSFYCILWFCSVERKEAGQSLLFFCTKAALPAADYQKQNVSNHHDDDFKDNGDGLTIIVMQMYIVSYNLNESPSDPKPCLYIS